MQQIGDIILIKCLGKGSFGEVYLSQKKDGKEFFATKKIDRKTADKPELKKYFDNEIEILKQLDHPNIVKLEGVRRSLSNYYIIMEYINGGGLSDCLKKYMEKHGKPFSEEIVQYLMKQIVDGIHYLHSRKIIHRDLKLDNIMVNFDSELDKENLNMMKAKIKIIDFGFATKLTAEKNDLTYSAVGSPINMDPIILRKFSKKKDVNLNIGYDEKADIWSIGTVCYELLIGKAVFNAKTMNDLVDKVEKGSYNVPKTVSQEVVSFLNGMLQYNSKYRLDSEDLLKHPFLTKNVSQFTKINTTQAKKENKNNDIQKNNSIWSIFADEEKLLKIQGGKNLPDAPLAEEDKVIKNQNQNPRFIGIPKKMERNNSNPNDLKKHNKKTSYKKANHHSDKKLVEIKRISTVQPFSYANTTSFYGQNMYPNLPQNTMPQMGMPNMNMPPQQPFLQYPSFGVPYRYDGVYPNQAQQLPNNQYSYSNTFRPVSAKNLNNMNFNNNEENCCIQ